MKKKTSTLTKKQTEIARRDPRLVPVFASVGRRPQFYTQSDIYFGLISAITAQQLSGKAADTIFNRFLDLCPDRYPHARAVLKLSTEQLRSAGLSRQKLEYIRNIARFHEEKGISEKILAPMTDDEVIAYLTQIKGVGRWTVEMILMFGLGRPDVFPADDLGIQQAMQRLYGFRVKGNALKKKMHAKSKAWQPHRSYVCFCLWRWKSGG